MSWDGSHNKNASPLTAIPRAPVDVSQLTVEPGTWIQIRIPKPGAEHEFIVVEISTDLHRVTRIYATEPLTVEPFEDNTWPKPESN